MGRSPGILLGLLALGVSFALSPETALANKKYAALVIHAETGDILFDRYSKESRYPASLTKMMTLYMLFEALENGDIKLTDKMTVSKRASLQPASRLGLAKGSKIDVESAIEALVIRSANDVATVVAEQLGGTESRFARQMTQRARALGMRRTTFRNASGLPDKRQRTTARDMAILSQRISQDFPQYFAYFDQPSFTWKGKTYKSHNRVAASFNGADGIKTGYTRASGYNLATTVERGDHRLIGIVLGGRSGATRDRHMREILDKAFKDIRRKPSLISAIHSDRPVPSLRPGRTPAQPRPIFAAATPASGRTQGGIPIPSVKTLAMVETGLMSQAVDLDLSALKTALNGPGTAADEDPIPVGEGDAEMPSEARDWSIQVGAYAEEKLAISRIQSTQSLVRSLALIPGREVRIAQAGDKTIYRARFTRLTETEAAATCTALKALPSECIAIKVD